MKRRRHTPEQIVRKLREVERLLGEGQTIAEAAKQVEISEQTYHRWRNQYGAMKVDDARRLRELERENARLKRIVADKELEIDALKEIAKSSVPASGVTEVDVEDHRAILHTGVSHVKEDYGGQGKRELVGVAAQAGGRG